MSECYTISSMLMRVFAWVVFLLLSQSFLPKPSGDPVAIGKQIYTTGTSPSGKAIFAMMSGVKVPAPVLPCTSCHGEDGTGRAEGGVTPSNITWEVLTKDNGGQRNKERTHPPYTESKLKRAISMGLDPANNELNKTMPRYIMGQEDAAALVAYLKVIGKEKDTGLNDATIKTGLMLPDKNANPEQHKVLTELAKAFFTEINEEGGIYNRNFDLHFMDSNILKEEKNTWQKSASCFALAGCLDYKTDTALVEWATTLELPVVGAVSAWPVQNSLENANVFYLFEGIPKQLKTLLHFACENFKTQSIKPVLIYDNMKNKKDLEAVFTSGLKKNEEPVFSKSITAHSDKQLYALIKELKEKKINTVFYFGATGMENKFLNIADELGWYPYYLSSGTFSELAPFNIPESFHQQVFLSYPTWFTDLTKKDFQFYVNLKEKYNLQNQYQHKQLLTLGAAMTYVEAVRNCGRQLSRQKLVRELEKMYVYKTGLIPPLTFGLNNRIGSEKIYIASVDIENHSLRLESNF